MSYCIIYKPDGLDSITLCTRIRVASGTGYFRLYYDDDNISTEIIPPGNYDLRECTMDVSGLPDGFLLLQAQGKVSSGASLTVGSTTIIGSP